MASEVPPSAEILCGPDFLCNVKGRKLTPEKTGKLCTKQNNDLQLVVWLRAGAHFCTKVGLTIDPDTFKHAIGSAGLVILHLLGKASKQERNML